LRHHSAEIANPALPANGFSARWTSWMDLAPAVEVLNRCADQGSVIE
jgi:hypothetical protein